MLPANLFAHIRPVVEVTLEERMRGEYCRHIYLPIFAQRRGECYRHIYLPIFAQRRGECYRHIYLPIFARWWKLENPATPIWCSG